MSEIQQNKEENKEENGNVEFSQCNTTSTNINQVICSANVKNDVSAGQRHCSVDHERKHLETEVETDPMLDFNCDGDNSSNKNIWKDFDQPLKVSFCNDSELVNNPGRSQSVFDSKLIGKKLSASKSSSGNENHLHTSVNMSDAAPVSVSESNSSTLNFNEKRISDEGVNNCFGNISPVGSNSDSSSDSSAAMNSKSVNDHCEQIIRVPESGTSPTWKYQFNLDNDSDSTLSDDCNEYDEDYSGTEESDNTFDGLIEKNDNTDRKDLSDEILPDIDQLQISVDKSKCKLFGSVLHVMKKSVIVQSLSTAPVLNMGSVLFINNGEHTLGPIQETFGPVSSPYYAIHFNSEESVRKLEVLANEPVYYAPNTEHTEYIDQELLNCKGSDASWVDNEEPPPEYIDYSDDEQERLARKVAIGKKRKQHRDKTDSNNHLNFVERMNQKNLELTAKRCREDEAKAWLSSRIKDSTQKPAAFIQPPQLSQESKIQSSFVSMSNLSTPPPSFSVPTNSMNSTASSNTVAVQSTLDQYTMLPSSVSMIPPPVPAILPPTSWTKPLQLPTIHYSNPHVRNFSNTTVVRPVSEFCPPAQAIQRPSFSCFYMPSSCTTYSHPFRPQSTSSQIFPPFHGTITDISIQSHLSVPPPISVRPSMSVSSHVQVQPSMSVPLSVPVQQLSTTPVPVGPSIPVSPHIQVPSSMAVPSLSTAPILSIPPPPIQVPSSLTTLHSMSVPPPMPPLTPMPVPRPRPRPRPVRPLPSNLPGASSISLRPTAPTTLSMSSAPPPNTFNPYMNGRNGYYQY